MGCSLSFLGVHSCLYAMVKVFQRKMLNLSKIRFLATFITKMIAIKTILVHEVHELGSKLNSEIATFAFASLVC